MWAALDSRPRPWLMDTMSKSTPKPRPALVALPEDVLSRLLSRRSVFDAGMNSDDEVDAALAYRVDIAVGEVAKALVETGRPLSHLHLLVDALEQIGFRRGYAEGAVTIGRTLNALAVEAPKSGPAPKKPPRR